MITGELKNKVDKLWEMFWTGGLTNPLDVIEQITYLMFIHDLDDSDNMRARESAMLGLPFQSIFSGEVKIGERTIDGKCGNRFGKYRSALRTAYQRKCFHRKIRTKF